jgi:4'-phosphopantetheinyl transferase
MMQLRSGEVQVWSIPLAEPSGGLAPALGRLSPEERTRAERFLRPADRRRFVVAHAALREILGAYLDSAAAALAFVAGPHGKPALAGGEGTWLRFNLSHSHEMALLACARECEVGADIEWMRDNVDCAEIVDRFFSPGERQEWTALPADRQREAFFHGWARKEAYVKALGEGLAHDSKGYSVRLDPRAPAALLADILRPAAASAWSLAAVAAPAGYAAALALACPLVAVHARSWTGEFSDFSWKPAMAAR